MPSPNVYTDSLGSVTDTGTGSTRTMPASTSQPEIHLASEIDTGSTLSPVTQDTPHWTPARYLNWPR
jgi:hypothetical protein